MDAILPIGYFLRAGSSVLVELSALLTYHVSKLSKKVFYDFYPDSYFEVQAAKYIMLVASEHEW